MAIIPVHTGPLATPGMLAVLQRLPPTWTDDGLSGFPDSVFGWDISLAGRVHDARYCTRIWPPGTLGRRFREDADMELGQNVRALLPCGLRWLGWVVARATYQFGGMKAFDSCGPRPYGTTDTQTLYGQCRHGVYRPEWMLRLVN